MVTSNTPLPSVEHPAPRTVKLTTEQAHALLQYLQNRPFAEVCNGIGWLSSALNEEQMAFDAGERERARAMLLAEARATQAAEEAIHESEFEKARRRSDDGEAHHINIKTSNGKQR